MLTKVWSGLVQLLSDTVIQGADARFKHLRVSNSDKLVLVPPDSADAKASAQYPEVECIRVLEEDTLEVRFDGSVDALRDELQEIQIWRNIDEVCPICARAGVPAELDHKHCEFTRERLPREYPYSYKQSVRDHATKLLLTTGRFDTAVPLLNGKRVLRVHSTTFSENDAKREWEQSFITEGRDRSMNYYSEQEARVHLAFVLDDDGNGSSPFKALSEEHKRLDSLPRTKLMMDFFKSYPDTLYRVMLEQVRRVDGLVDEVCAEEVVDHFTDKDYLALTEDLLLGNKFVTEVRIFGGKGKVFFTNASTEDIDKANEWAENIINDIRKDNKGVILKLRELDIQTVAKLAAEFRGDNRRQFDDDSEFIDRLSYLMELALPLFYMYVRAGNAWRLRALKAAEVDAVGNF